MITDFRYHSEKKVHSENFAGIAKFSLWLQNFRNPCEIFAMHSENPAHSCIVPALPPASSSASITSILLNISSSRLDEVAENSQHSARYKTKLEIMTEAHKTCKITKNKLETKSVVLSGPAHVNWLNSHD